MHGTVGAATTVGARSKSRLGLTGIDGRGLMMKIPGTGVVRRAQAVAILAAVLIAPSAASAATVIVGFDVNNVSPFDYTGASGNSGLAGGHGSFTFDDSSILVQNYGTTVITNFFGGSVYGFGTTWTSPITASIPHDPYSGAYGPFYDSYVFPNVEDYPSSFIEQFGAQANTFSQVGNQYAAYHIELRATTYSSPRNGDGTSAYAFTATSAEDFLRGFLNSGAPVYFNESYQVYTLQNGLAVYSDGKSWSDYNARITSVTVSGVPEPAAWAMMMIGFFGLGIMLRLSRHASHYRELSIVAATEGV